MEQYDNVIYGYNYPYPTPTSNSMDGRNLNLFSGITGDFLSSMTSALISGMGNGVTETFLPGTTTLNGVYQPQVDLNNIYSGTFYPSRYFPYPTEYNNYERNTVLSGNSYENLYKGSLTTTPQTSSHLYTMSSSHYPPNAFNGINGPRPLGSTFAGHSNVWGRPIIPIISSKDTTAFNGKFLSTLISKMGYQIGEKSLSTTTTTPSSLINQTPNIPTISSTTSPNDKTIKKDNLKKRKKRNIVNA
uniref:Uncharacterized protein n=1 Tax=Strongyloides venezuelensis TaxID=75913 RepID=A0A0K0FF20_STRVS